MNGASVFPNQAGRPFLVVRMVDVGQGREPLVSIAVWRTTADGRHALGPHQTFCIPLSLAQSLVMSLLGLLLPGEVAQHQDPRNHVSEPDTKHAGLP